MNKAHEIITKELSNFEAALDTGEGDASACLQAAIDQCTKTLGVEAQGHAEPSPLDVKSQVVAIRGDVLADRIFDARQKLRVLATGAVAITVESEGGDLNDFTKDELKEKAAGLGIEIPSKFTKQEIVDAIEAHASRPLNELNNDELQRLCFDMQIEFAADEDGNFDREATIELLERHEDELAQPDPQE